MESKSSYIQDAFNILIMGYFLDIALQNYLSHEIVFPMVRDLAERDAGELTSQT
jgi:hypothetical protein